MSRPPRVTRAAAIATVGLLVAVGASACGGIVDLDASVPPDAGGRGDLAVADGGYTVAGAFSVIGCATLDEGPSGIVCRGPAPLRLTFVPLTDGVTTFLWTFAGGDPATSRALTPTVDWAAPGVYEAALTAGGAGGTVTARATILVGAGTLGAACRADSDCDGNAGLFCLCGDGACPGGLAVGLCTRRCSGGGCGAGAACVDLTRGFPPGDGGAGDGGTTAADGGEPTVDGGTSPGDGGVRTDDGWRTALCLPACAVSSDCRAGLRCRPLLTLQPGATAGGAAAWTKSCFADVLGDVGAACFDAAALPDATQCTSGRCDPLGARGLCSAACSAQQPCPDGAGCVTFNGASASQCLAHCDATTPCTDPLLDCVAPGGTGGWGFTGPTGTFCAPRRCTTAADCAGGQGACVAKGGASFCARP